MVAIWINDNGVEVDVLADMDIHPAAELFPLMHGPEFDELVDDIALHGQRDPIVLTPDGQLLDGRNRWRACSKAGITPVTRVETSEPWAYVISTNVHRRHLSDSQRAMIGARIADRSRGGDRRSATWRDQTVISPSDSPPPTRTEASRLLNVGESSIGKARQVIRDGTPELQHAVESGEVPVSTGARVARGLDAAGQIEYVERVRNGAEPTKLASSLDVPSHWTPAPAAATTNRSPNRHRHVGVPALRSLRDSLEALDIVVRNTDGLDPAITYEEAAQWVGDLSKGRGALRRVLNLLNDRKESIP